MEVTISKVRLTAYDASEATSEAAAESRGGVGARLVAAWRALGGSGGRSGTATSSIAV